MLKVRLGFSWIAVRWIVPGLFVAAAIYSAPVSAASKDSCLISDTSISGSPSDLLQKAATCEARASSPGVKVEEAATARYNAARAYNLAGNYDRALALVGESVRGFPDSSLAQITNKQQLSFVRNLRVGRGMEKARAIMGQATSAVSPGGCARSAACLSSLSTALSEMSAAPGEDGPLFYEYYEMRADIYNAQGNSSGARDALTPLANKGNTAAQTKIMTYYSQEVDAALRAVPSDAQKLRNVTTTFPTAVQNSPQMQILRGKALLRLAQVDVTSAPDSYQKADEAFQTVLATSSSSSIDKASAHQGRGEALLGRNNVSDAINEFQEAQRLDSNLDRQMALGVAYAKASKYVLAEQMFDAGKPTNWAGYRGTKADLVDALIARAEAKKNIPRSADVVRAAYQDALNKDASSGKPWLGVARSLGATSAALPNVQKAIQLSSTLSQSELAEAYHLRSIILAANAKTKLDWQAAFNDADIAANNGNGVPPYKEEACLLRIVYGAGDTFARCNGIFTTEGALLRGMALLRSLPGSTPLARQNTLAQADDAFGRALHDLKQTTGGDSLQLQAKPVRGGAAPAVRVLLEYGAGKVNVCYGKKDVPVPITASEFNSAQAFYAAHNVDRCS